MLLSAKLLLMPHVNMWYMMKHYYLHILKIKEKILFKNGVNNAFNIMIIREDLNLSLSKFLG